MYHDDVADLLKAWDRGEVIWSISMGGMGPGYEQAIQIAAIEFAREGKDFAPTGDTKADNEAWTALCDAALARIDEALGGITGAMYGAASWLAWQWCCNGGPKRLMDRAKEQKEDHRSIQVRKDWPRLKG